MKNFNEAKLDLERQKFLMGRRLESRGKNSSYEQSSIMITNRKQSKFGQCNNTYKFGMTNKYKRKEETFDFNCICMSIVLYLKLIRHWKNW